MQFTFTGEQEELRITVRRLVEQRAPSSAVRDAMASEPGHDPAFWKQLGAMGALGLTVPEQYGGAGAGHVERTLVAEELGRGLVPSPFLGSAVLAADLLLALEDEDARKELLPGIASGEVAVAVAVAEGGGGLVEAAPGVTVAEPSAGGWSVTGKKAPVLDGAAAEVLLVHAQTPEGPAFFKVQANSACVERQRLRTLDPTRRMCRVQLDAAPAVRIAGDAAAALERVHQLAAVALGGQQVGGMRRALDLTVDYAKVRVQFGRPIGSFQSVKHACADMYATWEQSLSVIRHAAWTADNDGQALPLAAALVQVSVGPAYFDVAKEAVMRHGGLGYTWEHDAQLHYKRAKSDQLLLGSPQAHRARLADLLGI